MENIMTAIGYVTKQIDGRYKGTLRTVSIKADIDILPNIQKTADSQPDFRVMTEGIEIGAGWTRKGETSNKEYISLSIAAPEFGPKKLYANLGKAASSETKDSRRNLKPHRFNRSPSCKICMRAIHFE